MLFWFFFQNRMESKKCLKRQTNSTILESQHLWSKAFLVPQLTTKWGMPWNNLKVSKYIGKIYGFRAIFSKHLCIICWYVTFHYLSKKFFWFCFEVDSFLVYSSISCITYKRASNFIYPSMEHQRRKICHIIKIRAKNCIYLSAVQTALKSL